MSIAGKKESKPKDLPETVRDRTLFAAERKDDLSLDDHVRIFGKRAEDVIYTNKVCERCGSRFDEFGHCACGAGGN